MRDLGGSLKRLKKNSNGSTGRRFRLRRFASRRAATLGMAFVLGAAGAGPARAIVLNDGDAARAGGVKNYWDRGNTMSNVVSLYLPGFGSNCTGTLINSRTILTAAHCVMGPGKLAEYTSSYQIRFGADAAKM